MFIFSQYNLFFVHFRLNRYSLLIIIIISFIWYYCYLLLYVLLFDLLFIIPIVLENDYKTFIFNFSLYILVLFSSLLCLHSFYVSLLLTLYILIVYRTSIIRLVSALANSRSFLLSFLLVEGHNIQDRKQKTSNQIHHQAKSLNRTTTILQ